MLWPSRIEKALAVILYLMAAAIVLNSLIE